MIAREASARGYFHLALAGVVVPIAAFAITATLAVRALRGSRLDPTARIWTRRLGLLAIVDFLVMIAMIAILAGKASLPAPRVLPPPGPRIGVVLDPADTGHGARVLEVRPGSPAERAGILPGDVIERVDGQAIDRNADLTEQIASTAAGGSRALDVIRGAARVKITAVPEVIKASVERRSLFQRDGPSEPIGAGVASLAAAWAAVAVLLAIVCAVAARRGGASPRPWMFWIAFAGALAASDAALIAAHLITAKIVGGGSLGGALVGLCAGSATLLILAVVWRRRLGWRGEPGGAATLPTVVAGVAYMIAGVLRVGIILMGIGSLLHIAPPDPGREIHDLVGQGLGPTGIALLIFAAVILAPIGEETLFRGVLLPWLRRFVGVDAAVWISAVIFGIGHLRYGFYLSTIVVYGLVLGWARLKTGNLRASIVLHMIINAVATAVALSRV
jgi:membrane protease YdiL (CAAX protease family)